MTKIDQIIINKIENCRI